MDSKIDGKANLHNSMVSALASRSQDTQFKPLRWRVPTVIVMSSYNSQLLYQFRIFRRLRRSCNTMASCPQGTKKIFCSENSWEISAYLCDPQLSPITVVWHGRIVPLQDVALAISKQALPITMTRSITCKPPRLTINVCFWLSLLDANVSFLNTCPLL